MTQATNSRHLTKASLAAILDRIVGGGSEQAMREALADGAVKLQDAVLANQTSADIVELGASVPDSQSRAFAAIVDRAVSIFPQDDGSQLVTWLVPVALTVSHPAQGVLPLLTLGCNDQLQLTAHLQSQLGLEQGGWAYVLPALYHANHLHDADLAELIHLPHDVRNLIRGARKQPVGLSIAEDAVALGAGSHMFYLPFVARLPENMDIVPPQEHERVAYRLTKWIHASLASLGFAQDSVNVQVLPKPQPFAAALDAGGRSYMNLRLTEMTLTICEKVNVQPNGLVALTAAYFAPNLQDTCAYVLGVTLRSRLTGDYVGTVTLPMPQDAEAPEDAVLRAQQLLQGLGIQITQVIGAPIHTNACQHCGHLQYQMPTLPSDAGLESTCIQ